MASPLLLCHPLPPPQQVSISLISLMEITLILIKLGLLYNLN